MKKKSYKFNRNSFRYYRKFCNLRNRINRMMNTGEFYELSRDVQNRLIRRLKILYNRLIRIMGKQKMKWATAAVALIFSSVLANAQFNDPVNLSGVFVGEAADACVVDLDGDGDDDIVIGNSDGGLVHIINENGTYRNNYMENPFGEIDITAGYATPTFIDIDGDDDLDLVVGDHDGNLSLFENDGGAFSELTGIDNPLEGLSIDTKSNPAVADIDLDGDMDIVNGTYWGTLEYLRNDDGVFNLVTGIDDPFDGLDFGYYSSPAFADYDEDGDLDLLVGHYYGSIYYLENDNGDFDVQNGPSNPFNGMEFNYFIAPVLIDADADGDLDLSIGDLSSQFLTYFENDNDAFSEKRGTQNPFEGVFNIYGIAPAFVDLDDDGDKDLLSGGGYGIIKYWESTDDGFVPMENSDNPFDIVSTGGWAVPAIGDMDGDGDPDLVVGDEYGGLSYYTNEVGDFIELTGASNPFDGVNVGTYSSPTLADLDADGDLDLFVGSKYGADNFGKISYFRNVSGSFIEQTGDDNPFSDIFASDSLAGARPTFANIDGDGDLDLFIGEKYGMGIHMYENEGGIFTKAADGDNPFYGIALGAGFSVSPVFADLDDDGDEDFYVGLFDLYNGGNLYFVENTEDPGTDPEPNTIESVAAKDLIDIYSHNKLITIDAGSLQLDRVEVYAITGKIIVNENLSVTGKHVISMTNAQDGIYIVRAYSKDKVSTTKVIIR